LDGKVQRYILRRFSHALLSLLAMTLIIFSLIRLAGSPLDVMLDDLATPEDRVRLAQHLGLDQPLAIQYWVFLSQLARGDLGTSLINKNPVMDLILQRLPNTLQLAFLAFALSVAIAVPMGVYSAVKKDSAFDSVGKTIAMLGQATPTFWLGIMLMWVFAVNLGLLPAAGRGDFRNLVLPAITLGTGSVAGIMRLMRSSMLDVLDNEYVKMARIKGVPEPVVIWKHCLKNAAGPVVTFGALVLVGLLTGSVITETVFAWPGVGRLAIEAIGNKDYPVVQGVVLVLAAFFIVGNLLVDILYAYLDPKVRYQ